MTIINGAVGMGKTSLLDEAVGIGERRGVLVRRSRCDVLTRSTPLDPVLAALLSGPNPLLGPAMTPTLSQQTSGNSFWLIRTMQEALARTSLESPVMFVIDDLQWADPATLSALSVLTDRLAGHRVLWLVSVRAEEAGPLVVAALDRLADGGATRLDVGPLSLTDVSDVIRDVLGAEPEPDLPAALAGIGTQPLLLVELLRGWREEGRVEVTAGFARLTAATLPHRVRDLVGGHLRRLSPDARHAVQLGAALGRRFSGIELAELAGRPPVAMMDTVSEAIAAGLLVEHNDRLSFRHDLVRKAVEASVPAAVFSALQHRAVGVRLDNAAPPAELVALLTEAARSGDRLTTGLLARASAEIGRVSPALAVLVDRRALELVPPGDPTRPEIITRTAKMLIQDGRAAEAQSLISTSAGELTDSGAEALIRIGIGTLLLQTDPGDAIKQSEQCTRLPGLTALMRAQCLSLTACAWFLLGDHHAAGATLDNLLTQREFLTDPQARVATLIPQALQAMAHHDWRRSLELAGEAVHGHRRLIDSDLGSSWPVEAWQALLLLSAVRPGDALALADTGLSMAQRQGRSAPTLIWKVVRSRALFDIGRLTEARAEADGLLALSEQLSTESGHLDEVAHYVIGKVGLHLGAPPDVDRTRAAAARLRTAALPTSRRLGASLTALLTAADGASATIDGVADPVLLPVTIPLSHVDAVQLTRMLVSTRKHHQAETIAARLSALSASHPDFPFLQASATHARALVDADPVLAVQAAAEHSDDPRPLVRAAAHEDAGRLLPPASRPQAIAQLTEALALYTTAGAELDAARVRSLLRVRGVRHTTDRSKPAHHAWPELTDAQVRVAHLAAAGSTNRAIAERLHLSPHTVNSHLRHVFDKLGVRSRVALTRIVTERSHRDGL